MPEAVIVSAARSPIGRANKGSLKDFRPDDLTASSSRPRWTRSPTSTRRRSTTATSAAACPGGESGNNMARVVDVLLGLRGARRDDHPLLLLLGADHADGLPRDQGRRGRHLHLGRRRDRVALRQGHLRPHARHPQPALRRRGPAPTRGRRAARTGTTRARTASSPTSTSRWARPPRTSPRLRGLDRKELDEFGVRSQNLAEKAIADGFWEREITPVTTPDGTVVSKDDGPRAGVTYDAIASSSRSSAPTAWSPPATAAPSTTAPPRS